jgi:hypothetical protein
VEVLGTFVQYTGPHPQIRVNTTGDGIPELGFVTEICDMDIWQDGHRRCPPKLGKAIISFVGYMPPGVEIGSEPTVRGDMFTGDGRSILCVYGNVTIV